MTDLLARIKEADGILQNNRQRLVENAFKEWYGWYDERDIGTVKSLLSDLQTLFENPSEQVNEALEIVESELRIVTRDKPLGSISQRNAERMQTTRTALLSLTAECAEQKAEIERLRGECVRLNNALKIVSDTLDRTIEGVFPENPNDQ